MNKPIIKYKVVRRGQKYCVRVKGALNTTDAFHWCRKRKMSYHIKLPRFWDSPQSPTYFHAVMHWDYDFIFDEKKEALTFVLGYL